MTGAAWWANKIKKAAKTHRNHLKKLDFRLKMALFTICRNSPAERKSRTENF